MGNSGVQLGSSGAGGGGGGGTVTNTGGALTANALVLGAGGSDTKVSPSLTTDGTANINVGSTGVGGTVTLFGTTSGSMTFTAPGNATLLALSAGTLRFAANASISTLAVSSNITINPTQAIVLQPGAGDVQINGAATGLLFFGGKGQHIKTQAANNDIAGTLSIASSTTGSITFTTAYTSAPVVVVTPQTTGLTSYFLSAISTTGFTLTVAPSGTYTFSYMVIGNPT